MTVYEEVSEAMTFGNHVYLVTGCHRDWNPMPGHTPPEGTVWELTTQFMDSIKSEQRTICGTGKTKEEAIRQLAFMAGFQTAASIMAGRL
jgi:hypothetical protein